MSSFKRKAADTGTATSEKKARSITSFFGQPTRVNATPEKPAVKFDKAAWLNSLSDEKKDLLQLEIDTLDDTWLGVLKDTITEEYFLSLKKFLRKEKAAGKTIFPKEADIYSWSRHTPLDTVKVVILGQDPYHNVNQAHGLCFSVLPPTRAPPSLANMYLALKRDFPSFTAPANNAGLLLPWADRGVLLLNSSLTVEAHKANSHANKGWETFTQKVIDHVAQKRSRGVVFMAWGANAAKRVSKVDKKKHLVLEAVHPSPLSAHRGPVTFFECQHFKKANEWLSPRYNDDGGIDWNSVNPNGVSLFKTKTANETVNSSETKNQEAKETTSAANKTLKEAPKDVYNDEDEEEAAMREVETETNFEATKDALAEGSLMTNDHEGKVTRTGKKDDEFLDDDADIDWAAAEKEIEKVEEDKRIEEKDDEGTAKAEAESSTKSIEEENTEGKHDVEKADMSIAIEDKEENTKEEEDTK